MAPFLAYVEANDPSQANMTNVLITVGLLAMVALLAFAVLYTARLRRHRQVEAITVVVIFWGLAAMGELLYWVSAQINWTNEQMLRLQTGYAGSQEFGNGPGLPWKTWAALILAYLAILGWTLARRNPGSGQS